MSYLSRTTCERPSGNYELSDYYDMRVTTTTFYTSDYVHLRIDPAGPIPL